MYCVPSCRPLRGAPVQRELQAVEVRAGTARLDVDAAELRQRPAARSPDRCCSRCCGPACGAPGCRCSRSASSAATAAPAESSGCSARRTGRRGARRRRARHCRRSRRRRGTGRSDTTASAPRARVSVVRAPALSIGANTSSFCPGPKNTPKPPRMTVLSLKRAGDQANPDARPEVVVVRVVPLRARRAEPAAGDPPDLVAAVLLDRDRVELVAQAGVDRQVRPPLDVVLDVAERPPALSLHDRKVDDAEACRDGWPGSWAGWSRSGVVVLPSPTSIRMRRSSPPNLMLCRPRTMADVAEHAEGAAVLDDFLRTGQRREARRR